MSAWDDFRDAVLQGVKARFEQDGPAFIKALTDDAMSFAERHKNDLVDWGRAVAAGEMTPDDMEFLVKGLKDLFEVHALTQAGIAAADLQRFRNAVFDIVTQAAVAALPG